MYKIKRFSTSGRIWAGTKGAVKTGAKGAMWGAALAPGNLTALAFGKPKIAAGITAAGAAVGAGIGGKIGYTRAVDDYDYEHDPEYRKKRDKENAEATKKAIKQVKEEDLRHAKNANLGEWTLLNDKINETWGYRLPKEVLDYIKFYTNWSKKIDIWYSNMSDDIKDPYGVPEFKSFFPAPYSASDVYNWFEGDTDFNEISLLAMDDTCDSDIVYGFEEEAWGYCMVKRGKTFPTLKELLLDNLKTKDYYTLSPRQEALIREFKSRI